MVGAISYIKFVFLHYKTVAELILLQTSVWQGNLTSVRRLGLFEVAVLGILNHLLAGVDVDLYTTILCASFRSGV